MNFPDFFYQTYLIIIIITIAGFFGGSINYYQSFSSKEDGGSRKYITCVIVGLGASFLVPLFLKMISSDLINIKCDSKECINYSSMLVFFGICLVAAIFSKRFIKSIGDKILKEVEEVKDEVEKTKKEQSEIADSINTAIQTALLNAISKKENKEGLDDKIKLIWKQLMSNLNYQTRLSYLNSKVNDKLATQEEKDELMSLLYKHNHITSKQYEDYRSGRNADSIVRTGLIIAGILLLGYLLQGRNDD